MAKIQLFVCCHQPSFCAGSTLFSSPIQVGGRSGGGALPRLFAGRRGSGTTSPPKNRSYCELTAQYWAWKHAEADFYGFFPLPALPLPGAGGQAPLPAGAVPPLRRVLDRLGYGRFGGADRPVRCDPPQGGGHASPGVGSTTPRPPSTTGRTCPLVRDILLEQHPEFAGGGGGVSERGACAISATCSL